MNYETKDGKHFWCPECNMFDIHNNDMRKLLEDKYGTENVWKSKKE